MAPWLLERVNPSYGPLVGDLLEERQRGRSREWLWWQVLVALAAKCVHDIRAHVWCGAAALLTGWLFVWVAGLADSVLFWRLPSIRLGALLADLVPANAAHASMLFDAAFAAGLVVLAAASGWLVVSLSRPLGLSMVLVYFASFSLFGAYRWVVHIASWFSGEPILAQGPPLMSAPWSSFLMLKVTFYFPLFSAGILLGGYCAACWRSAIDHFFLPGLIFSRR